MSRFTKIVLKLGFVILLIDFGISFKSSNPVTQGDLFVFLLIIVYLGYEAFVLLCEKINELNKSVKEVEKFFINAEHQNDVDVELHSYDNNDVEKCACELQKDEKLDKLLFEVAQWAISVNGLSTSAVQRHFSVGYSRAGKIVDQLYGLGVCGPSKGNSKPRAMLVDMDQLMQLERSGRFG